MSTESLEQLPFDKVRQTAVLGHLLFNERFFKQAKDRIKPQWFVDGWCAKVWGAKLAFYQKYGRISTIEELQASEAFRLETQGGRTNMGAKISEAQALTQVYGLDTLLGELTSWLHARAFQDGVMRSQDLFNNGKLPEAFAHLDEKLQYIKSTSFDDDPAYNFENMVGHLERRQLEVHGALSFGLTAIDKLLLPLGQGNGSLLKGDTTILLAPTNVGKTSTMITVAAHNIRVGKPVLMLTHEGVDDDIAEKVMMSILNRNKAQLYEMPKGEPEERRYFDTAVKLLGKYFTYLPMSKAGLCVEEVAALIRRKQEERIGTHGAGYELLIDDYPAKLWSTQVPHGQFQKRNLDEYVYNYFVQLALEYKFHALLAIQGNRTAAKINRGQKGQEDRLLTPEDVNESYGPMQIATNILTINRSPWDERNNYVTYYLGKSRSGEKGWAIACRSNYGNAITHSDSLKATYYRGDVPLGEYIEQAVIRYAGQEIPRFKDVEELASEAMSKGR